MDTGLPRKKRSMHERHNNNFAEKWFLPFVTVIVTSIFYFTGWVYISHWYSYYGIDATQISIPLQLVLLHGFPGILFLVICGLTASLGMVVIKNYLSHPLVIDDLPSIVILAYLLGSVLIFAVIFTTESIITIPAEVWFSSAGLLLLLLVYFFSSQLKNFVELFSLITLSKTLAQGDTVSVARIILSVRRIYSVLVQRGPKAAVKLSLDLLLGEDTPATRELDKDILNAREYSHTESQKIKNIFKGSWQLWIVSILVFYFLVSVSSSALLGEWDAARGGRLMVGNWHISEISLYSTTSIPSLEKMERSFGSDFVYKPLGLLSSDDKSYFLVDWKTTKYYEQKPHVYIIPRSDDLTLNFIVLPFGYSTPTPVPTKTNIPTVTPTISFTSTPTP